MMFRDGFKCAVASDKTIKGKYESAKEKVFSSPNGIK
jgi:hypothetical protein